MKSVFFAITLLASLSCQYSVDNTEFAIEVVGSSAASGVFQQLKQAYMNRQQPGVLRASVEYESMEESDAVQSVSSDAALLAVASTTDIWAKTYPNISQITLFSEQVDFVLNDKLGAQIKLSPDLLARIFSGNITAWDDQALAQLNPTVNLPAQPIVLVLANSSQLTTAVQNFFATQTSSAAIDWASISNLDQWPTTGSYVTNPQQMISTVISTPFSIGYVSRQQARSVGLNTVLSNLNAYPTIKYGIMLKNSSSIDCRKRRESLRFITWQLTSTDAKSILDNNQWTIANSNAISQLKTITCAGKNLFGESPCDIGCVGGSCQVGTTIFNAPEDSCTCNVLYKNVNKKDCSELAPVIQTNTTQTAIVAGNLVEGLEFVVPISGASQTASLFQQMALSYPTRDARGTLTAGIDYRGLGTGLGINDVMTGKSLVASSLNSIPANMSNLIALPQAVGSVVMVYNKRSFPNLAAGQQLIFPHDFGVKVYLGDIKYWNDPYLQDANPGIALPAEKIIVVAGSDYNGGATNSIRRVFSQLDSRWNATKSTDKWPLVDILANGSIELISRVILTPYSIGYAGLETAIATETQYAIIKNSAGQLVLPDKESITAAFDSFYGPQLKNDRYIGGTISNSNAKNAYPYVFFYYEIIQLKSYGQCRQRREAMRFVQWSITSSFGRLLIQNGNFVPLPSYIFNDILELMKQTTCDDKPLFGASPCDEGCEGGKCSVTTLFNPPEDVCQCDIDYINTDTKFDCSEPRPAEFVSYSEPLGATATALSVVFAVYTLAVMGAIAYFRKLALIKALSPLFCIVTLLGLLLEFIGIFLLIDKPTDGTCSLRMWFLSLPLAVIFAAIIVKQYRLVTVFENKVRASLGIKNHQLLMLIGIIVFPAVVLLIIYTFVANPEAYRFLDGAGEYIWICRARSSQAQNASFSLLGIYHIIQVGFSVFLAFKCRNVRDEFNESRAIALTVYLLATVSIISTIILVIPQLPFRLGFAIRVCAILVCSFAFSVILFLKPIRNIVATSGSSEKLSRTKLSGSSGDKMKIVNKGGVMVAETNESEKIAESGDSEKDGDDNVPVKKIKEDAWKWQVYARPQRFLERWRRCNLTFHKELGTISLVQRQNMNTKNTKNESAPLCVCFPIKAIKLIYRGYNVTGGSHSSSNKIFKAFDADKTAAEIEDLVLEMHVANMGSFVIQMRGAKQAEQIVGLFTGSTLKDTETQATSTSRHGSRSNHQSSKSHQTPRDESEENSHTQSKSAHIKSTPTLKDKAQEAESESEVDDPSVSRGGDSEHAKSQAKSNKSTDYADDQI